MSNLPLHDNLTHVRVETETGDLLPVMDLAGTKFAELIAAVSATNKGGTLTMKVDIRPSTAGALAVKADVTIKKPRGLPAESLLWATPEGNLIAEDPRQKKLELQQAPQEPVRTLRTVKSA